LALVFRDHSVVLSEHILNELAEHYVGKFKASGEQVSLVVETLRKHCEIAEPAPVSQDAFDDLDDLPVLGTAVAGQADCLITGDKKLLELGNHEGIPIHSPRQFYDRVRTSE